MARSFFVLILYLFLFACNQEKAANKKSGFVQAGGFKVYFEEHGAGDPILLLHAGLQDHQMWDAQVQELSKNFRVITIDLPFHGQTTGADTAILAKNVVSTVLDSLQVAKVNIGGLSMGGAVAMDFVVGYPERVNKAIFISAGLNGFEKTHPVDSVSMAWYTHFTNALQAKDTAKAALEFAKAWAEGIDHRGNQLNKSAAKYVYQTTLATLKKHRMAGWPNLQDNPTAYDEITKASMPVLLIHGDKDLPFIETVNMFMEKNLKNARRVRLKDVAHMLNMEKPNEVNILIRDFLTNRK